MTNRPATITIVCELSITEKLSHKQAKIFEEALKKAAAEVFPDKRISGLWVHERSATSGQED